MLYRSCDLPFFVPQAAGIPGDIAIRVKHPEFLRALKPTPGWGYRTKVRDAKGPCARKLPDHVTCTYALDLQVEIHRLTKKEILDAAKKGR
jgi:hypothetical protein